jgi:hypothetical protein
MRYLHGSYAADLLLRTWLSYAIAAAAAAAVHALARPAPPGSRRRAAACAVTAAALLAAPSALLDFEREAVAIVPMVGIFSLSAFKVMTRRGVTAACNSGPSGGWSHSVTFFARAAANNR